MSDRRVISVSVLREYPSEWTLDEFHNLISTSIAEIPAEFRGGATVELAGGYDESVTLTIGYTRLQTDEEMAEEAYANAQYDLAQKERERRLYEQLKAKFEKSAVE